MDLGDVAMPRTTEIPRVPRLIHGLFAIILIEDLLITLLIACLAKCPSDTVEEIGSASPRTRERRHG
jgi:hypothetical protein